MRKHNSPHNNKSHNHRPADGASHNQDVRRDHVAKNKRNTKRYSDGKAAKSFDREQKRLAKDIEDNTKQLKLMTGLACTSRNERGSRYSRKGASQGSDSRTCSLRNLHAEALGASSSSSYSSYASRNPKRGAQSRTGGSRKTSNSSRSTARNLSKPEGGSEASAARRGKQGNVRVTVKGSRRNSSAAQVQNSHLRPSETRATGYSTSRTTKNDRRSANSGANKNRHPSQGRIDSYQNMNASRAPMSRDMSTSSNPQPQSFNPASLLKRPTTVGLVGVLLLASLGAIPAMQYFKHQPTANQVAAGAQVPYQGFYDNKQTHETYYFQQGKAIEGQQTIKGGNYFFNPEKHGAMHRGWLRVKQPDEASKRDDGSRDNFVYYDDHFGMRWQGPSKLFGQNVDFNAETGELAALDYAKLLGSSIPSTKALSSFNGASLSPEQEKQLLQGINALAEGKRTIGFVLIDLQTGQGISYNNQALVYSASSIKAPYLSSLFASQYLKKPEEIADDMQAFKDILIDSSNDAYYAIKSKYGQESFRNWCAEMGVTHILPTEASYSNLTAKDLALMWLHIYADYAQGYIPSDIVELASKPNMSAIASNLSTQAKSYSKAGWYPTDDEYAATNEAGIVVTPQGSYLVAMVTNIPDNFGQLSQLARMLDQYYQSGATKAWKESF